MHDRRTALSELPRIDALVAEADALVQRYGRRAATAALRDAVAAARSDVLAGGAPPSSSDVIAAAEAALTAGHGSPPRRVINATGVVIHTNLGRAPLGAAATQSMIDAAGYCDVEFDLGTGERGSRDARVERALTAATGAEAGIAVNNAAAALVLALAALAGGRDVVVSRGELVEIGGSFRLPEIMGAAGVRLVEVGTTNRTRADDYAVDGAALLLKVHPSNYRMSGFTESPSVAELADVAARRGIPLVHDVGSGLLRARTEPWLRGEPSVEDTLRAGAGLAICSGDKLLGGPQAGLLVGDAQLVRRCARHPLARALRLDKLRTAALVATLDAHARDDLAALPVWQALTADRGDLEQRLQALAAAAGGTVVQGASVVGGGAAPEQPIASPVLRIELPSPDRVAAVLRQGDPPVIVRVVDDAITVDLRTVDPADDETVARALADAS